MSTTLKSREEIHSPRKLDESPASSIESRSRGSRFESDVPGNARLALKSGKLCGVCRNVLETLMNELGKPETRDSRYPHHSTSQGLIASAGGGCYVCYRIREARLRKGQTLNRQGTTMQLFLLRDVSSLITGDSDDILPSTICLLSQVSEKNNDMSCKFYNSHQ